MFNIGDIIYAPNGFKLENMYLCKPTDRFRITENASIINNYHLEVLQDMEDEDHYNKYYVNTVTNNFFLPKEVIIEHFKVYEEQITLPRNRFQLIIEND